MAIPSITAGLIQARLGSTRLPGKILKTVNGRSLLERLIERLRRAATLDVIGVVTTGSPNDDPIAEWCRSAGVYCFRGSDRDLLDRYYRAARELGAAAVVRLTSDCPLLDPDVVDTAVTAFHEHPGGLDVLATTEPLPNTYPDGMDVTVIAFNALEQAWLRAEKPSEREHVTFYFFNDGAGFRTRRLDLPQDRSGYRFCIDYPDDFDLLNELFSRLDETGMPGTMDELIDMMDREPALKAINSHHRFGEGWAPSLEKDSQIAGSRVERASSLTLTRSEQMWPAALRRVPGGAQTFSKMPNQFINGVAPKLLYRGRGGRVWDVDGNEFVDFVLGLGPVVLGHCFEEVNRAAAECAADLFCTPSLPHPLETQLCDKLAEIIPCAEMVRFGKNGSDATAGAIRLARGVTGRHIVGCCGYHGWQDWYIGQTPRNRGILPASGEKTIAFQYNDLDSVKAIFQANPDDVAALILEPVNFAPPESDFLHELRALCDHYGAVLIFDEVITGFRMPGLSAQRFFGVTPDLACFAKGMSNGHPISAICGKGDIMKAFEDVFYSFTYAGEVPSMAASLATIGVLERENVPEKLMAMGDMFIDAFNGAVAEIGVGFARAYGYGFWPKYEFQGANGYDSFQILSLFNQELVRRGVLTRLTPFICFEHNPCDIREFNVAARQALRVVHAAVTEKCLEAWLEGDVIQQIIRDPRVKH